MQWGSLAASDVGVALGLAGFGVLGVLEACECFVLQQNIPPPPLRRSWQRWACLQT